MQAFWGKLSTFFPAIFMTMLFTGCGGGGGGGGDGNGDGDDCEVYNTCPPPPAPTMYSMAPTLSGSVLGSIFVTSDNLTLYTFENDRSDSDGDGASDSDCNAACADLWPPMLASASATASGDFSIILRDDGAGRQWALKGLALYKYVNDLASGDVNGEGLNNIWFVARPDPLKSQAHADAAVGTIIVGRVTQTATDGNGAPGDARVDREGFTLYTFENDRTDSDGDGVGDSDCNSACAEIWPPLFADSGATANGDYSIVERDDGVKQWALNGLPLYFYANDSVAGNINGEAVDDLWFIARPTPITIASSALGGIFASTTPTSEVDGTGAIDSSMRARSGFSLYVFDEDVADSDADGAGDSDCNAACAVIWPPMFADAGAVAEGDFSIIQRDDGSRQWAYKNEPLYFFASDSASGDVNGDQVASTWHLARNAPVQVITDATFGDIFAARGGIEDVDGSGNAAGDFSDKTGFTLYLFDDDANDTDGDGAGDSDCNASCAVTWPPLYAGENDIAGGGFTIITRDDGSLQWAYQGAPLYFFNSDNVAGDVNGVYGSWHEVNP